MAGVSYEIRANTSRASCASLEELVNALEEDISAGAQSLVPECTTAELCLDHSAIIPLQRPNIGPYADGGSHDLPPQFKSNQLPTDSHPQATVSDIVSISDTHVRAIVQRAASRGIVAAIEALDGFKYSFNNAWAAKDDDGQRFSYICQDSMQNKDRHANNFTRTQKHLKGDGEKGVRKPTFDCKGSVSVKCSWTRRSIDVMYRHYAIHATVAERRKGPVRWRPNRTDTIGSTFQTGKENDDYGGLVGRLQAENSSYSPMFATQAPQSLKRKREIEPPEQSITLGEPLSLLDLLNQSPAARSPLSPIAFTPVIASNSHQSSVAYDLPSWAPTPGPPPVFQSTQIRTPAPPKRQAQTTQTSHQFNAPNARPYQPNQPDHPQHPQAPIPRQKMSSSTENQPLHAIAGTPKQPQQKYPGVFMTLKPVPQDQTGLHRAQPQEMFSL